MFRALHALFGGTFDPIHFGHLFTSQYLAQKIGLQKITFIPNNIPVYKSRPGANSIQRFEMLQSAIIDLPLFEINTIELQINRPVHTIETMEYIRNEYGKNYPLVFILGQDSFLSLNQWYRWKELLLICHLLVFNRLCYIDKILLPNDIKFFLNKHITNDINKLYQYPSGYIFMYENPIINISATEIRKRCQQNQSCNGLLPDRVINYINKNNLYKY